MDVLSALRERKTVRGFLDRTVAREIIRDILLDAHWAPSSSNQQPWRFHVVAGEALQSLCADIGRARLERRTSYDPSRGTTIPAEFVQRTKKLFKEIRPLIASLEGDNKAFIENGSFRFYGAPVVVFITMHKSLPPARYLDIGMAAQNLMLSAHGRKLGTCAIALTLYYADTINAALGIDVDSYETLLSIALGYPDETCAVNAFRSGRDDLDGFITWSGC